MREWARVWAGSCEGHAVICLASCARNAPHLAVIKAVNYQQCSQSLQHSPRLPASSPPPLHCHRTRSLLIQHSIERTVVSNTIILFGDYQLKTYLTPTSVFFYPLAYTVYRDSIVIKIVRCWVFNENISCRCLQVQIFTKPAFYEYTKSYILKNFKSKPTCWPKNLNLFKSCCVYFWKPGLWAPSGVIIGVQGAQNHIKMRELT